MLVFHAKIELQRPPSGASRPGDVAAWPPSLQGHSGSSLEVGNRFLASTVTVRGRPASPRPAGLALAWLRLVLHRLVDHLAPVASQVELGSDSSGYHWIWAQLDLVQAFRSCLVKFAELILV